MENKRYTLFASILEDWYDEESKRRYDALDIEYYSEPYSITTNDIGAAIKAFQKSSEYVEFSERHINVWVYTYIIAEGDTIFQRADLLSPEMGNIDD